MPRSAAVVGKQAELSSDPRGRLRSVHLVLTSACNLRCSYCYQDRRTGCRMRWSTVTQALRLVLNGGSQEPQIGFYGGEPLLAFDLIQRTVEEAQKRRPDGTRPKFRLTTNGVLLDSAKAAFLHAHGVETQVSFDGTRAAQERRAPKSFDRVAGRLEEVRREHPDFCRRLLDVALTLPVEGISTLAESVDRLLEMGIERISIAPAIVHHISWSRDAERELDRQLDQVRMRSLSLYEQTGRVPVTLFRRGPGRPVPRRRSEVCGIAEGRGLAVDVDGTAYGCAMLAHSFQSFSTPSLRCWVAPLSIGQLDAIDFEERFRGFQSAVRRSPLFAHRELKHSSQARCHECRALAECSLCPLDIARTSEDPQRVPEFLCAFNRLSLAHRERFPAQLPGLGQL